MKICFAPAQKPFDPFDCLGMTELTGGSTSIWLSGPKYTLHHTLAGDALRSALISFILELPASVIYSLERFTLKDWTLSNMETLIHQSVTNLDFAVGFIAMAVTCLFFEMMSV